MTTTRVLLNETIYGLTRSTVQTFSEAVKHGYSFNAAQRDLASTYADNKALAHLPLESRLECSARAYTVQGTEYEKAKA